ncbi:MAG: hypothetical protein ACK41O_05630 [Runella zeae]
MKNKITTIKQAKKRSGIEVSKLDAYVQFLNDELLWEPDDRFPHKASLTEEQRMMYRRYSFAFAQASMGRPDSMILSAIEKDCEVKEGMARIILREAYYIFGDGEMVSKKGKTRAAIMYLEMLSNLARSEKDYKTAKECWVEAKKLEGLYYTEGAGWNPDDFKVPPMIVFTGDIKVLQKQQRADDE